MSHAICSGGANMHMLKSGLLQVIFEYPPLQQPQTAALWGHLLHQLLSYLDSGAQPDEHSAQVAFPGGLHCPYIMCKAASTCSG
jgi:hypothetical protein